MKRKKSNEQLLHEYRQGILENITAWKHICSKGCNDPFWPDGCNMNLCVNHVIYYKELIEELCMETGWTFPEEYYIPVPPEVDDGYMANLDQVERVDRLKGYQRLTHEKVNYDEQQLEMRIC